MSIENADYIHQLDIANPKPIDPISEGDNHIRLIKKLLVESFPSDLDGMIVPDVANNENKYLQVNSDATKIQWQNVDISSLIRRRGEMQRPWFEYRSSAKIRIHSGLYDLDSKNSNVHWTTYFDKTITKTNGWRWLYLINDSITGNIVTANDIVEKSAVPTYDEQKGGWYNGDDRCIFTFYVSGGNLTPFYHDGSTYVEYRDDISEGAYTSTSNVNVTIPPLGTVGEIELFGQFTFQLSASGGNTSGSNFSVSALSGSGHILGRVEAGTGGTDDEHVTSDKRVAVKRVSASLMQIYLIKSGGAAGNRCTVSTNGYYLPRGM